MKESIQELINQSLLSSLGNLLTTISFRSVTRAAYNADTGEVTSVVVPLMCKGVLLSVTQEDTANNTFMLEGRKAIDPSLVTTMRKVIVPTLQLIGVDVDALDDEVDVGGIRYQITGIKQDPAEATFTFFILAQQGMQISGV